ncbi:MarR family transcriptional regulator [Rhizobium sp. BK251]|uniref:MarR family winged helix-turn-helix transcriptional regulator n=1 Tax=Rhizobium sp. BK251 TaxID=2512125 RepID=UPI0010506479|nr:MarR family transcriptional regulator [Rhizobium sp. BK251]TCL65154.1 DNA-binding MarR family transcriptional regulator [Rhizobium sp. BK251]
MSRTPSLGFLLHDVARLLRKRFEQRARCHGLTRAQWQALACLAENDGIQQSWLAEMLEIEPITLVRIIDRLAERGLVERRQHPTDRRAWLIHIREAALPLLDTMHDVGDSTRGEAFKGIPAAERERLFHILTLMKSNLSRACTLPAGAEEINHG